MIISLVGYMGSGKSHVSKLLSEKLNFNLIDLDKEIATRCQLSIPEIFRTKGEIYFRKHERELLEELLATAENTVISLGGGTPAYYNNMQIISAGSVSIYLRTRVATLAGRLKRQKAKRPLIANIPNDELPEFIAKHLFERNNFYNQARYIIDTDDKTPEEIVAEIIRLPYL